MAPRTRTVVAAVAVVATATVLADTVAGVEWSRASLDVWSTAGLLEGLRAAELNCAAWAADLTAAQRSAIAKDGIVGDLAAGRITLAEAVGRFRTLGRQRPRAWAVALDRLRDEFPGCSDDECLRRNIVQRVRNASCQPAVDRNQAEAMAVRLETELGRPAKPRWPRRRRRPGHEDPFHVRRRAIPDVGPGSPEDGPDWPADRRAVASPSDVAPEADRVVATTF